MSGTIDFYFDFSSPYGYFAVDEVERLAAEFGRECRWIPILLGPAFQASGNQPLAVQPLKGDYCRHDWDRLSRLMGVPYRLPPKFPAATVGAARAFWVLNHADPLKAKDFARAVFAAYFADGRDISDKAVIADIAAEQGHDRAAAAAAMEAPVWKNKCKDETAAAIARGVFGSPFVFVDGEGFWGGDRLWMVKKWLERGIW